MAATVDFSCHLQKKKPYHLNTTAQHLNDKINIKPFSVPVVWMVLSYYIEHFLMKRDAAKSKINYALPFAQGTKVPCPSPLSVVTVVNAAAAAVIIMPIK